MVSRVMPYVNAATDLVPEFGKLCALGFTVGLLGETFFRSCIHIRSDLLLIQVQHAKCVQSFQTAMGFSYSERIRIMSGLAAYPLFLPYFHNLIVKYTGVYPSDVSQTFHFTQIESDRPPLVSFVQVAAEMVNIASKILGSLATGIVVQKMATGNTTGKIRWVVSTAFLALSAWNVKNAFQVNVKSSTE